MISPRVDAKAHGVQGNIDGVFEPGQTALLVDDLITTSASKLEAIFILSECGLWVRDVAVLVDREQGGVEELKKRCYACHAVFKLSELLDLYLFTNRIDGATHDRVTSYLHNNT